MEEQPTGRPKSLAGIKEGVLYVQVDLQSPNAELMALGFLTKAGFIVNQFFGELEQRKQLIDMQRVTEEKNKIDLQALKKG